MQTLETELQRRAIIGDRHFILADPAQADIWALPGAVIIATDSHGNRRYGAPKTIHTRALQAWAQAQGLKFRIEDSFPVTRLVALEELAA